MGSSIYFDGLNIIRPQARGKIDASGMTPLTLGAVRAVMIFGLSKSGVPKQVYSVSDPNSAVSIFGSGDLLTAAQRAWGASPSQPGATVIQMVRVDPATQGAITLASSAPANLMTLTSLDYGAFVSDVTHGIYVTVAAGTSTGKKITITQDFVTEIYDNQLTVAAAVAAINALSSLVSAALVLEGTLANLSATVLTGGTTPAATNTDWQNSFNTALTSPANYYVPTSVDASIQALLAAVVKTTCIQNKRGGIMFYGHAYGEAVAAIKARVTTMNSVTGSDPSRNVLCTPGAKQFNSLGQIVGDNGSMFVAAQCAGMAAGMDLQEPLTYKYISALGLEAAYTPANLDDFDQNGVLAIESVVNKGFRIVHGQTNYLADTNTLFREISVRDIADEIMSEVVSDLEAFVGRPGIVATITSMKIKVASRLDLIKLNGWIFDGVDSVGNPLPAYRNIQISYSNVTGIASVSFQVNPTSPINYVLVTGHFTAANIVV